MPISVTCPHCGKQIDAPDRLAGKRAKCAVCKNVIEVPLEILEEIGGAAEKGNSATAEANTSRSTDMVQIAPATRVKAESTESDAFRVEFDFAVLALKGRRLDEAQQRYTDITLKTNSPAAWCGLGLVKLQRIIERKATFEEAEFCFDRARQIQPEKAQATEVVFLRGSADLFSALLSLYNHSFAVQKQANSEFWAGVTTVGFSALMGAGRDANLYQQLSAASGTAYGAYLLSDAGRKSANADDMRTFALQLKNEIKTRCASFCENSTPHYMAFGKAIHALEYPVFNFILSGHSNEPVHLLFSSWSQYLNDKGFFNRRAPYIPIAQAQELTRNLGVMFSEGEKLLAIICDITPQNLLSDHAIYIKNTNSVTCIPLMEISTVTLNKVYPIRWTEKGVN